MNGSLSLIVLLVAALVAASLPFLTNRVFALVAWTKSASKPFWLRLVEWFVLYLAWLALGKGLEASQGGVAPQAWQFYAITLGLFLVAAYPAFVWCYLWRRQGQPAARHEAADAL